MDPHRSRYAPPTHKNPYDLRVDDLKDKFLDVYSFEGKEYLSRTFHYTLRFTCSEPLKTFTGSVYMTREDLENAHLPKNSPRDLDMPSLLNRCARFALYGKPPKKSPFLEIPTPPHRPLRSVFGVITRFCRIGGSADQGQYQITLEPRLARLRLGKRCRIFQWMSVPKIVRQILEEHQFYVNRCFQFDLKREYPPREQVMQYDESDLDFIERLLAEVGIWYRFACDSKYEVEISGQHLQLAARDNLMLNAGGQADLSVVKRLFIGVGQGLSLFVRRLGIRLVANQGPVQLQAQNDSLGIMARQGLEITSTEDEIRIVAKKKITLNAGGSYLVLDPCRIEAGTEGDYNVKAPYVEFSAAASMSAAHPEYPLTQFRQPLRFTIRKTPNAPQSGLRGMPYRLYSGAALVGEGVLDENGQFQIDHQVVSHSYSLQLANGMKFALPIPDDYNNPEQGQLANLGLHNHPSEPNEIVNRPATHKDHRARYSELVERFTGNKEENP